MKTLRVLLSLLALVLLVIIFAVASLYFFIDPNKLKPVIIAQVKRQTGFQLTIPGNLSWDFYPHFAMRIEHMFVTAPNGAQPFAELHQAKIGLPISQWLRKQNNWHTKIFILSASFANLNLHHAILGIRWQNQNLQLTPIAAALYGGTLSGDVTGTEFTTTPKWQWRVELHNIQVKPLLDDLGQKQFQLSGIGNFNLNATSSGKNADEILQHMNGTSAVSISQGSVKGVDLNYLVMTADALINSETAAFTSDSSETLFDNLNSTVIINDGIGITKNLTLMTPAILGKGQGTVNLPTQTLDLQLQVSAQHHLKTQWTIPILISGKLSEPKVNIDKEAVEKWLARQDLDKVKTKVEEKINELLPKANEFLQKILR